MNKGKLTIVGSLTSPFVRVVRTVCEELQLPYDMDLTVFFAKQDEAAKEHLSQHNPLMRVPVLIDGEKHILDSRIILSYLLKHPDAKPLTDFRADFPRGLEDENRLSVLYGIVDAGVLYFIMRNLHPEVKPDTGYLVQSQRRIRQGLEWLDKDKELGEGFGIPELVLLCGLEWFKKREVVEWTGYSHLRAVHARYHERPSLVKTCIPENA
ncbi:MAG: glutathione S-transferase family protein [Rickettsiales bacterium]